MTLLDYADCFNLQLVIRYWPKQNRRFTANFEGAEMKNYPNHVMIVSARGEGQNPKEAMKDYVRQIRGKILITNATNKYRRECTVPHDLKI